ncbi:thioredoxin-like protein [Anaeramoeba flamelloides]|uniref:Thioredoxin-like protein n=1 Tax=Anaeramoeba flamelloides TaxID=1746091 RepID=A0AAV7ZBD6_9EUKA|nr:thioredoxin-like protein [Anaeramoeba flamelloides]KAJ6227691.1 thioredoxin-like protein [Anaeramoeba flamelloides]
MDLGMLLRLLGQGQGGEEDHGNVIVIKNEEEYNKHTKSGIVVVDFFATWCMPCKLVGPVFVELSKKYPDVKFLKVDVDQQNQIAKKEKVRSMPTFHFYKGGEKVDTFSGADPVRIEETVKELGGVINTQWKEQENQKLEKKKNEEKQKTQNEDHGNVKMPNSKEELMKIFEEADGKLVVIDFYASWCGPCQRIGPIFVEMSKEFEDVIFVKINVDSNPNMCDQCSIRSIPAFCFFHKVKNQYKKFEQMVGANVEKLRNLIVNNK